MVKIEKLILKTNAIDNLLLLLHQWKGRPKVTQEKVLTQKPKKLS